LIIHITTLQLQYKQIYQVYMRGFVRDYVNKNEIYCKQVLKRKQHDVFKSNICI